MINKIKLTYYLKDSFVEKAGMLILEAGLLSCLEFTMLSDSSSRLESKVESVSLSAKALFVKFEVYRLLIWMRRNQRLACGLVE